MYSKPLSVAHDGVGLIESKILASSLQEEGSPWWEQWIEESMAVEESEVNWDQTQPY